jgi:transposase InsO family protein
MTEEDEWMISFLDDHSRFVPGSNTHHNPTAEHAIKLLEESMKQYGKPNQILTDRGSQFYPARGGVSEFTEFCSEDVIEHIVASVRRASTIGRIEAFHKAFVNHWDYERSHQEKSYLHPADV